MGRKIRATYVQGVRPFKKSGLERRLNRNKSLRKYNRKNCDKSKNLSRLIRTVIVFLVIEIIIAIFSKPIGQGEWYS